MGKQWKQCLTLFLEVSKITTDGDCSHETKRHLLLGRKVITNLEKWSLSCVWLFVTPWTVDYQAPLSMGFSRQENSNVWPLPSPGCLSTSIQSLPSPSHLTFYVRSTEILETKAVISYIFEYPLKYHSNPSPTPKIHFLSYMGIITVWRDNNWTFPS